VCEILSPCTARTLEPFALEEGGWVVTGKFKDDAAVTIAPFGALDLELEALWAPDPDTAGPDLVDAD